MPPEKKIHEEAKKMQIQRIKRMNKNTKKSRRNRRDMKKMNTDNHHHMKICIVDT